MAWRRSSPAAISTGSLVVVGGAEERSSEGLILQRLVGLCRAGSPAVVVVDAASPSPTRYAQTYRAAFLELGARVVLTPRLDTPEDAGHPDFLQAVDQADLVYFAGGDQSRLANILRGTSAHHRLLARHQGDGLVVGGTSAGAAALSLDMIARGESELWPRKGVVRLAEGLGFTSLVIDQHFSQRGRLGRLIEALAALGDPEACGVGVDENTALVLSPDGDGEVVGQGGVAVVRLGRTGYASWQNTPSRDIVSVTGAEISILRHGDRVPNLDTQEPLAARGEA
ncbi:MAG: cyanophycinase [Candidatus Eisenbacteria bacterium]|nr:cyanophycinase [Candidatus Eisenbacteria bacterium]